MTTFYICRHGNTFDSGDTVTRVGARTDLSLSSSGTAQAQALANHFEDISFAAAFASPLLRTRETASAILAKHYQAPPLLIAPFLTEIDYGPDENKPETDVEERLGTEALRAWDADAIPPDGWLIDPPALISAWAEFFFRSAKARAQDQNILVVTSNGIARFILDVADRVSTDVPRKLKTGAYGKVTVTRERKIEIEAWNVRP